MLNLNYFISYSWFVIKFIMQYKYCFWLICSLLTDLLIILYYIRQFLFCLYVIYTFYILGVMLKAHRIFWFETLAGIECGSGVSWKLWSNIKLWVKCEYIRIYIPNDEKFRAISDVTYITTWTWFNILSIDRFSSYIYI